MNIDIDDVKPMPDDCDPKTGYDRVIAKLRARGTKVIDMGGMGMAQCPAHDDISKSLILQGRTDGSVDFECTAGCGIRAISDALDEPVPAPPPSEPEPKPVKKPAPKKEREPKPSNVTTLRDRKRDNDRADADVEAAAREAVDALWGDRAKDGRTLRKAVFPPRRDVVPRIIPEGHGLLVAPPKKGKSFLAADIALGVAAGGLVLGKIRVEKRPVLYLALEDGWRRLQSRFERILGDVNNIPDAIQLVIDADHREAVAIMDKFISENDSAFVIVDTMGKIKPPKLAYEDSYAADVRFGNTLKELASAPGVSIMLVHHTRKAETFDFIESVSGTQGVAGTADFTLVLRRKRFDNDAVLAVTGRDIEEAEYALTAEYGILWRLDGNGLTEASAKVDQRRAQEKLGDRSSDVFMYVCNAGVPVTAQDVAKAVGVDRETAGRYLRRLAERGDIKKLGRGQYVRGL